MSDATDDAFTPPTAASLAVDRKLLGIALPEAAALIGVSQNVLRNWERGRRSPGAEHYAHMRELLDEHTTQAETLAATNGPWQIRPTAGSKYPPGWAVAVVARAREIRRIQGLPIPVIEWAEDTDV